MIILIINNQFLVKLPFYPLFVLGIYYLPKYLLSRNELIKLIIDTAIPCGLIINGVVTSTIKHAFPESEGILIIEFTSDKGEFTLIVSDNRLGYLNFIKIANL